MCRAILSNWNMLSTADRFGILPPSNRRTQPMPPPPATLDRLDLPLCVDLDGTLIKTDLVWESLVRLLKRNPLYLLVIPFWWIRGRAVLKRQLATRVKLDPATLPYNASFLAFLRQASHQGRRLVLVTASDALLAQAVAGYLGLFDEVLASDGKLNLRGRAKSEVLTARFGPRGFDYAGNSTVDIPVWESAAAAVVVDSSPGLEEQAGQHARLGATFPREVSRLSAFVRALRPHHWVKNLIIFVPLLTSHQLSNLTLLARAGWAFAAFCLCASAVYMLNDLLDLDSDRQHPAKKARPFASGELPLAAGLVAVPLLLAAAVAFAATLSWSFVSMLACYFLLTTAYSWFLRQIALLDVFTLAGLYTVRLGAGGVATGVEISFWLWVFSMFIFLSLALVKRFVELLALSQQKEPNLRGRGYLGRDLELVASLGSSCGFLAVLVLALYVNSQDVLILYHRPKLLLLGCPILLFWISRVWLIAHRARMADDPIVFALRDWVSHLLGLLMLLVLWLAGRP